jgi:hypothetical protein
MKMYRVVYRTICKTGFLVPAHCSGLIKQTGV